MVWEVERHGRRSTLVGAAHFFPRHFRRDLRRLIEDARLVLPFIAGYQLYSYRIFRGKVKAGTYEH